jgi:hypothetical protein
MQFQSGVGVGGLLGVVCLLLPLTFQTFGDGRVGFWEVFVDLTRLMNAG